MKKLLSFLLFIIYGFAFTQNCNYQISIQSENLKETGKFTLNIKNTDTKSFKIRKEIGLCNMRLIDLEFFNEKTKFFEKTNVANKDVDCFTYKDKDFRLKPSKTYVYNIDIKSDFEVLQNTKFFETSNDKKYRFKISFTLDTYDQCGESNNIVTDWIYKN